MIGTCSGPIDEFAGSKDTVPLLDLGKNVLEHGAERVLTCALVDKPSQREIDIAAVDFDGRRVGFTLAEIREIIDLYDASAGEAGQLHFLIDKIADRRTKLERTRVEIDLSLKDLDGVAATCRERLAQLGRVSAP